MRLVLLLCLFSVFACRTGPEHADAITISLSPGEYDTPFQMWSSVTQKTDPASESVWEKLVQPVNDIPDSLRDAALFVNNLQIHQLVFQSFASGLMDSTFYEGWTGGLEFDEADYTTEFVDQQIHFLLARGADSSFVLVVDADNDESFAGETAHVFPGKRPGDNFMEVELGLPRIPVTFDMYDGERVVTGHTDLVINPYVNRRMGEVVLIGGRWHRTGVLDYDGRRYAWWVGSHTAKGALTQQEARIWFEPLDAVDSFPVRPRAQEELRASALADTSADRLKPPAGYYPGLKEPYVIGDIVRLGGDAFELTGVSSRVESLTLERADASATGLRLGLVAPDFEGPSLDGSTVRLSDYRGRYVLIDFWGTWCAPCVAELPHLRVAYDAYPRDRFDILAIASNDDPDVLEAFIEEEELPWAQVVQRDDDEAQRAILKAYRITGYPTTFLLDPDGVIVAREGELRGEALAETLTKHLGEAP